MNYVKNDIDDYEKLLNIKQQLSIVNPFSNKENYMRLVKEYNELLEKFSENDLEGFK